MTDQSRALVLSRRSVAISDFSDASVTNTGITLEEAGRLGMYRLNAVHLIGIATAQEVGLAADRWPVRVLVAGAVEPTADARLVTTTSVVCKYWRITDSSGNNVAFQRRPLESELTIRNLYAIITDFDDICWASHTAMGQTPASNSFTIDPALAEITARIYATISLANPTAEQLVTMRADVTKVFADCAAAKRVPYIQISPTLYVRAYPHGLLRAHAPSAAKGKPNTQLVEAALTLKINFDRIVARNTEINHGVATWAAYGITSMFRYGYYESYEHKEYVTVLATPVQGSDTSFTVSHVQAPEGYVIAPDIAVGATISLANTRLSEQFSQLGSMLVFCSGLMHYMFNHTTGGSVLTGPMLSVGALYNLVNSGMDRNTLTAVTSAIYEAVHPSNKRAIANIFFPNSLVYTHGRHDGCYKYQIVDLDAFAQIRKTPYPAGSHKAFAATQGLKRIAMAGLAPFLPWSDNLNVFLGSCRDILSQGARAHIGSAYYTGLPSSTQASSLDEYLPDIARYMQTFHAQDSLSASPHLSATVAARSSSTWTALCRGVKQNDVSGTSPETVRRFLATTGVATVGFDANDEATWGTAAAANQSVVTQINAIFV